MQPGIITTDLWTINEHGLNPVTPQIKFPPTVKTDIPITVDFPKPFLIISSLPSDSHLGFTQG